MYGLDADLIMLALVTHEPNFCLLREVVKFGGGGKGQPSREALDNPSAEHFVLFQVGLLRDYFDAEFRHLAPSLPFGYDPERVVDDFVLFCMLIGNDFLPALPTLDINEGALDTIFKLYKELLPKLGGYMTRDGALDRGRLAVLLGKLGEMEGATLQARARDAEEYASKQQGRGGGGGGGRGGGGRGGGFGNGVPSPQQPRGAPRPPPRAKGPLIAAAAAAAAIPKLLTPAALKAAMAGGRFAALAAPEEEEERAPAAPAAPSAAPADESEEDAAAATPLEVEVAALALSKEAGAHDLEVMAALEGEGEDDEARKQEPTMMSAEARALFESGDAEAGLAAWTERYWRSKLGASTPESRRAVADAFLAGVTWVLEYYYRGVASWTWFYAYHYAPTAAELAAAALAASKSKSRPAFERGEPFRPYQQLLAVLPAASAAHLPEPFRPLMLEATSPIADFYPADFDVDLEGKRAEWEGVVLIPFVDEERLLEAAARVPEGALSAHEKALNRPGEVLLWSAIEGGGGEGRTEGAAASGGGALGDATSDLASTVPSALSSVLACNSRLVRMPPPPPIPDGEPGFTHEPPGGPKARGAPPAAGFPTLRGLPADAKLRMVQANVLGMPSKRESVVLKPRAIAGEEAAAIAEEEAGGRGAATRRGGGGGGGGGGGADGGSNENVSAATMAVARAAIGTRCWIRWPYLVEARVVAVSDGLVRVEAGAPAAAAAAGNGNGAAAGLAPFAVRQLDELSARAWADEAVKLRLELLTRRGIDVSLDLGEGFGRDHAPRTLLHARPAEGLVRLLDGTVEKRWSQEEVKVPPSLVLRRNPAPDPRLDAKAAAAAMQAMGWRPGARALFLGRAYYGCLAVVLPPAPEGTLRPAGAPPPAAGTLRIALSPPGAAAATAGAAAKRVLQSVGAVSHSPAFQVSRRLGISPRALGRITGPLFVNVKSSSSASGGGGRSDRGERVDVGLCVKHGGRKLCVPDYVCPAPDDRGWLYSPALGELFLVCFLFF
jgi:5'-3' exoribonuclease 1